jgi:TPP-dependent 2-oxoacid decarboxylase
MLTLDSQQLALQRRTTELLRKQEFQRSALQSNIKNKEITVAADGEISTTSLAEQLGQPLSSAEFIKRLERMNKNFLFEVSEKNPELMGVYIIENRRQADGSMKTGKNGLSRE